MKKRVFDCFVVGFALFSILFGAGNLIFPPFLGALTGSNWFIAFVFFILADLGLVLLGIFSFLKNDSCSSKVYSGIGKVPAFVLELIMIICLGPLIAIPRTGATSYEIAFLPYFNINIFWFLLLYFIIVYILSIKSSKVVEIVGKYLTPILFIFLIVLIVMGIIKSGDFSSSLSIGQAINVGWNTGYQTLDVLSIAVVVDLLIKFLKDKGYVENQKKMILFSSLIAIFGIFIVYCGLTYLGALSGNLYNSGINQANFLLIVSNRILGQKSFILAIIVLLACLTTAVGLTSSVASYFVKFTNKKYSFWVLVITMISFLVANIGLSSIVKFAIPILSLLYPIILVLMILSFFKIKNTNIHKMAVIGTLLISLFRVIYDSFGLCDFILKLPFSSFGFEWVTGAIVFGLIGFIWRKNE